MARLPALLLWNSGLHSHHSSVVGRCVDAYRIRSGRVIDSTLITSAPRPASAAAADGPAHHAVQSTTRVPLNGSAPTLRVSGRAPGSPVMRNGTRGCTNRPDAVGPNTPRSTNCVNVVTVAP